MNPLALLGLLGELYELIEQLRGEVLTLRAEINDQREQLDHEPSPPSEGAAA